MTPEQINMAIAESCGWTGVKYSDAYGGWQGYEKKGNWFTTQIPNYHGDLNAMREAEKSLDVNQWRVYSAIIAQGGIHDCWRNAASATAAQRAEAFLRTLGKWKVVSGMQESPNPP